MIWHRRLFHTHLGPRRPKRDADKGTANPRGGHNRNLSEVIDRPITAPGSGARAISEPRLRSATAAFYMIYIYIGKQVHLCNTKHNAVPQLATVLRAIPHSAIQKTQRCVCGDSTGGGPATWHTLLPFHSATQNTSTALYCYGSHNLYCSPRQFHPAGTPPHRDHLNK